MGLIHTVGLVLHPNRDCAPAVDTIIDWATQRGATVLGLPDEVGRIDCAAVAVPENELVERAELLVSLGGDGTMLRTMRLAQGRRTPVLGVNVGRLGFLAEVDLPQLDAALSAIDAHDYTVEPRSAVRAQLPGGAQVSAFNDIALVRSPGDGLAAVGLTVEGHNFVRYAADAVIVATATGSTAYSFSAGGPIVSPRVEGLLVGASSAHSSFNRFLVMAADEELVLEILPASGKLAVEVDGIVLGHVGPREVLPVHTVPGAAQVVRLGRTTFYERARRKLQVSGSAQAGSGDVADAVVVDNFAASRYEIRIGADVAGWLHYRRTPDHIDLQHTEVEPAYAGQGLAGRLAAAALADVRARATALKVTCPFVTGYLERHPEYADLVGSAAVPAGER